MEIIVGLTIGAILIGTASFGIAFMLRSTTTNQNLSTASQVTQGLLNNIQSFSNSSWQNIYGLSKGSSNRYFLSASGTAYLAVAGNEGLVSNDITNGLIAEWKFDESTGTIAYDATGNNNNGVLNKGASATTTVPVQSSGSVCKMGNCLLFNGFQNSPTAYGNWVLAPHSTTTDISGSAITISAWIYPLAYPTSTQYGGIIRHNGYNYGYRYNISSTGNIIFQLTGATYSLTSNSIAPLNSWTNIVGVLDSGIMKLYFNGVQDKNTTSRPGNLDTGSEGVYIGVTPEYSSFNGYIDDARIYNRTLLASEILQVYNSQIFNRYFYVENVCRTNDSAGSISSSSPPCSSGLADDPLTQKVTAITQWTFGAAPDQVSLSRYLSRWGNFSIRQSDWSGGSGQNGSITNPNNLYSTSSNVTVTSTLGSFQILNLSP